MTSLLPFLPETPTLHGALPAPQAGPAAVLSAAGGGVLDFAGLLDAAAPLPGRTLPEVGAPLPSDLEQAGPLPNVPLVAAPGLPFAAAPLVELAASPLAVTPQSDRVPPAPTHVTQAPVALRKAATVLDDRPLPAQVKAPQRPEAEARVQPPVPIDPMADPPVLSDLTATMPSGEADAVPAATDQLATGRTGHEAIRAAPEGDAAPLAVPVSLALVSPTQVPPLTAATAPASAPLPVTPPSQPQPVAPARAVLPAAATAKPGQRLAAGPAPAAGPGPVSTLPPELSAGTAPTLVAGPEAPAPDTPAAPPPASLALAPPPPPAPAPPLSERAAAPSALAPQIESAIAQVGGIREALRAVRPAMTLPHAEFGMVSLRLEPAAPDQWRAVLASRDPGFVPAIHTALAERAVAAAADHPTSFAGQQGAPQNGPSDHRYGASPNGGQGSSQPYPGQSGSRDGEAASDHRRPSTAAALAARGEDGAEELGGGAPGAGGLFA